MRLITVMSLLSAFLAAVAISTEAADEGQTGSEAQSPDKAEAEAKQLSVDDNQDKENIFNVKVQTPPYRGGNYGTGYDVNGRPNYSVGLYSAGPAEGYKNHMENIQDSNAWNQIDKAYGNNIDSYDPRHSSYDRSNAYEYQNSPYNNDQYNSPYDNNRHYYNTGYDSRYNNRYDNRYNNRYDSRFNNRYDAQYGNRYDNRYDSLNNRYDNQYGYQHNGIRYDNYPAYDERVTSRPRTNYNRGRWLYQR